MLPVNTVKNQPVKRQYQSTVQLGDEDVIGESSGSGGFAAADLNKPLSMEEMKAIVGDVKAFSSSSKMRNVMNAVNDDRRRSKFIEKINHILNQFNAIKLDDNDKRVELLFLFVMQSATDYLGNDDNNKDEICRELLVRFVKDDEDLCKNIMNLVRPRIKPLTFIRRNKHRIGRACGVFFATTLYRAK